MADSATFVLKNVKSNLRIDFPFATNKFFMLN